jgi:hypothetical protein
MKNINKDYTKGALKSGQIVLGVVTLIIMLIMWHLETFTFSDIPSLGFVMIFNLFVFIANLLMISVNMFGLKIDRVVERVYLGKF